MDYMYERLHVPYPLTIEVTSHGVLSCTRAHVGSASVCKLTRLCNLFCQVSHISNSLAAKHVYILSTELAVWQTSATVAAFCVKLTVDAMQDMFVDLQTCNVVLRTQPVSTYL